MSPRDINNRKSTFSAQLALFFTFLLPATWLWITWDLFSHYSKLLDHAADWLINIRVIVILLVGVFLARVWRKGLLYIHDRTKNCSWMAIRGLLYVIIASVVMTSTVEYLIGFHLDSLLKKSFFNSALLAGYSCWFYRVVFRHKPPGSILVRLEIVAFNLAVALILCEYTLRVSARHLPNPVLYENSVVSSKIDAYRLRPHTKRFNFKTNSLGYYDEEFFKAAKDDLVVTLIADSFGAGIVPYQYNFATIAEQRLRKDLNHQFHRVAIHNFGVSAIELQEYMYLLRTEALSYDPALVILCIFIGNDIHTARRIPKRLWYTIQEWWLTDIVKRIFRVYGAQSERVPHKSTEHSVATNSNVPDYILDSSREAPTMSRQRYLELCLRHLEVTNVGNEKVKKSYSEFLTLLEDFSIATGDRLRIVVIPEEFQVNDKLWHEVLDHVMSPQQYDRDHPQNVIRAFCNKHGIPCLDLLEPLRATESEQHTYHLQDSHWNARGNQIAGEQLHSFIMRDFRSGTPP